MINIIKEVRDSFNNQELKDEVLIGIGETFIESHKLQDKVTEITLNQSDNVYGYYRKVDGVVNINKDMIFKLNDTNMAIHQSLFTLYHELTHAVQFDCFDKSYVPDYVKHIVKTDDAIRLTCWKELKDKSPNILPIEHNANVEAAKETYIIYHKAGLVGIGFEPIYTMTRQYDVVGDKVISPIEKLYEIAGIDIFNYPYINLKNIKLYNRMNWGLPVTNEEYNKVITKHIF